MFGSHHYMLACLYRSRSRMDKRPAHHGRDIARFRQFANPALRRSPRYNLHHQEHG